MTSAGCVGYVLDVVDPMHRLVPSPERVDTLPYPSQHPTRYPILRPAPDAASLAPKGVDSCLNYTRVARSTRAMVTTAMAAQMQLKCLKTLQQIGEGTWFCNIIKAAGLGGGSAEDNGEVMMGCLANFIQVDEVSCKLHKVKTDAFIPGTAAYVDKYGV